MGNERIVRTFALALLGLVAFAVWRPSSPDPTEDAQSRESWFFINKAHPVERFDGVIYGDSRSLRGISPGIIGQEVPGLDLYNFSWNAGGMNPEMYREIENLLDPDAPRPVIILAPTALSLQTAKVANDQFHQYRKKPMDQVELYRHLPRLADWFQPVSPSVYLRRILGIRPHVRLEQEFHATGWIETDQVPPDDLSDLSSHRERMEGEHVDPALIGQFMDQTRAWTGRGIRVFACFVPGDARRIALEDSMLGFDKAKFKADFVKAGGTWLDLPQTGFESYDGSHLVAGSARQVSELLGRDLAADLATDQAMAAGH